MSAEPEAEPRAWPPPGVEPARARFSEIPSRGTVDYALRTVQQGLTHFSAMADAKANILITVCALALHRRPHPARPHRVPHSALGAALLRSGRARAGRAERAADLASRVAPRHARGRARAVQPHLLHALLDAHARGVPRRDGRAARRHAAPHRDDRARHLRARGSPSAARSTGSCVGATRCCSSEWRERRWRRSRSSSRTDALSSPAAPRGRARSASSASSSRSGGARRRCARTGWSRGWRAA